MITRLDTPTIEYTQPSDVDDSDDSQRSSLKDTPRIVPTDEVEPDEKESQPEEVFSSFQKNCVSNSIFVCPGLTKAFYIPNQAV